MTEGESGNEGTFLITIVTGRRDALLEGDLLAEKPGRDFGLALVASIGEVPVESSLVMLDERALDMPVYSAALAVRGRCPAAEIGLVAEYPDITLDVEVMKAALFDVSVPPLGAAKLANLRDALVERAHSLRENRDIRQVLEDYKLQTIISHSPDIEKVLSIAARAAASDSTILIRGESGTGKELIARAVHLASPRKGRPFVAVNIAALSENLIESELFGHAKGSFTGAMHDRPGRFEQADGGTLFIDEIGDIPPGIQVKLLRTLQFGSCERVGENEPRESDVRIIAATNRDIEEDIHDGRFRADLFYRVNVIPIQIPPLREHMEDVPYLVEHFIKKYNGKNRKRVKGIAAEAMATLVRHDFPGNVRELENMIERGIVLCRGEYITCSDILIAAGMPGAREPRRGCAMGDAPPESRAEPEAIAAGNGITPEPPGGKGKGYVARMHVFERALLSKALDETRWNRSAAARTLGISERRLRNRLKILGME